MIPRCADCSSSRTLDDRNTESMFHCIHLSKSTLKVQFKVVVRLASLRRRSACSARLPGGLLAAGSVDAKHGEYHASCVVSDEEKGAY